MVVGTRKFLKVFFSSLVSIVGFGTLQMKRKAQEGRFVSLQVYDNVGDHGWEEGRRVIH